MKRLIVVLLSVLYLFGLVSADEKNDLVVGGDRMYPPYEYLENGKPTGFNVELIRAAAELAGYKVIFRLTDWHIARSNLENGSIDAISGMYYSKERAREVDFSLPYLLVSPGIFTKKNSKIKDIKDLNGKKVSVQNNDIMHDYVVENYTNIALFPKPAPYDALKALLNGEVDAVLLSSKMQGAYYLSKSKMEDKIDYFDAELPPRRYCFAVTKGNEKLLEKLNESLFILKTNGTYKELYEKWFGRYAKKDKIKEIVLYSSIISGILLILFFISLAWSWSLKEKVKEKTSEITDEIEKRIKAEEQMKTTLNSIGDGVISIGTDKSVLWLNPVAESILGVKKSEFIGTDFAEFVKLKNSLGQPVKVDFDLVVKHGKKKILEDIVVIESLDGSEYIISGSGAPIKDRLGNIIGGVFVIRDITKEYELERQLQHSQKMDALGRLAGGVAHDFNNILSGILGVGEILETRLDQNDENLSLIKILKHACNRASTLTSKLLAFSKKSPVEMKVDSIHDVIEKAVSILRHGIDPKINIEVGFKADFDDVILNRSQIENVLINLGVNAKDAMPDGGVIEITTSNIYLNKTYCDLSPFDIDAGDYILIIVKDTGFGMSIPLQKKIFDPFFTTKEDGTGLGLASVYGMIQQHSGAINVYSEQGEGTEFRIYLPVEKDFEKEDIVSPVADNEKEDSGTILLIDDEDMIRKLGRDILSEKGYSVIIAENGEDGLKKYKENITKINLVILDIIMPVMDGEECLEKIMEINKNAKVIISSGFYKSTTSSALIKKGASGFIKKPYSSEQLLAKVREIL